MYASVGGELLHYGVKGMKWGVRKERETKSRGGQLLDSNYSDKHDSDYVAAFKMYNRVSQAYVTDKNFKKFVEDTGRKESFEQAMDYFEDSLDKISGIFPKARNERQQIGEALQKVYDEYKNTPEAQSSEAEKNFHKEFAEMVDSRPQDLPRGTTLRVAGEYIDDDNIIGPYYVLTTATGKKTKYTYDQLDLLKRDIDIERKKKYDYRETAIGKRVREKNITGSTPVKVQKREKIKVSDDERSKKIASSKKSQEKAAQFVNGTLKMLSIKKSYRDKFNVDTDPINRLPSLASKRKTSEPKVYEKKEEVKKLEKDGRNWLEKLLNIHEKSK